MRKREEAARNVSANADLCQRSFPVCPGKPGGEGVGAGLGAAPLCSIVKRGSPHPSVTNKILKQQSVLTKSSALIHNYPCNSYYSFYHPLALIPIIPSRTVSTLLSLGISHNYQDLTAKLEC